MRANEFLTHIRVESKNTKGSMSISDGKKSYKLNLESIEKRFGEIHLGGGTTLKNQKLLNFLHENNQPDKVYEYILLQKLARINGSNLNESIDSTDTALNSLFQRFDSFSNGNNIKIGDRVAVLELEAMQIGNSFKVELSGFLNPKEIVDANTGYIQVITGETYPRIKIEQVSMWRQVIFFTDKTDAEKCLTYMNLLSGKSDKWDLSIDVQSGTDENLDEDLKRTLGTLGAAGAIALGGYNMLHHKQPAQLPSAQQEVEPAEQADPSEVAQAKSSLSSPIGQSLKKEAAKLIKNKTELAQFLAQCAHESQGFSTLKELGDNHYFNKYDIRYSPNKARALGNDDPGDGIRYKGRGLIQLTGKANYERAGDALNLPLVKHPKLAERPDIAIKIALWYWLTKVKPKVNNFSDTSAATAPINRHLAGLPDRHQKFLAFRHLLKPHHADSLKEYKVDNVNGWGQTPINQNVDYQGLRVMMRPSTFLELAAPLKEPKKQTIDDIVQHLNAGGALGSPFLLIKIPAEWDDGDFSAYAKVSGHEGRNRMIAIQQVEGDDPVEVHLFPVGYRNRHMTPEFVKNLNKGLTKQLGHAIVRGSLFTVI